MYTLVNLEICDDSNVVAEEARLAVSCRQISHLMYCSVSQSGRSSVGSDELYEWTIMFRIFFGHTYIFKCVGHTEAHATCSVMIG